MLVAAVLILILVPGFWAKAILLAFTLPFVAQLD